ncbi:hypothetical protein LJ707_13415 [Mucilaginibacter sp. UR6-1]|uniref:hypothetical protein n=1 Tax=Mucilaginibacter sp. UR6-1 TaxID=1435643 RepID=UPI001E4DC215|nr:hypothetical protein [Mucilaginibacter sp. UR6-1]MCC8409931.1 hypothetical protein [Mucilaginibacter sp. UR6-1]
MVDYLKMVLTYLKQELPVQYKDIIELDGWVIKFVISDEGGFDDVFADIKRVTETYVRAIRERKADLNFTVWRPNQSRDFIIYK